jgi:hypothetical protein
VTRILPEGSTDLEQVLWLTVLIVVGMVVVTAFSVSMSRRDSVSALAAWITRSAGRPPGTRRTAGLVATLVVTPVLVVVWALVLTILLAFLMPEARLDEVATIAAAMVAATRILAYAVPSTARVLADVVPLALVVLLLTGFVGDSASPGENARFEVSLSIDPAVIVGLVVLELVLRALASWLDARRKGDGVSSIEAADPR